MPAEIELSNSSKMQYEGGEDPPAEAKPRKMNKMEKQKEKHKEKLGTWNMREASPNLGDTVINLDRKGMTDPVFCGILIAVFLATIGLGIYGFTAGGTVAYAPILSDGTQCGHFDSLVGSTGQDATSYPYLYFPVKVGGADVESLWDSAVCVKSCPSSGSGVTKEQYLAAGSGYFEHSPNEYVLYETTRFGLACRPTKEALENKDIADAAKSIFGEVTKSEKGV